MKDLLEHQQSLKRSKLINQLILITNTYALTLPGLIIATIAYDINDYFFITGLGMTAYSLTIGLLVVMPYCIDREIVTEKKLDEVKNKIKQVEEIHRSLDTLRNSMLFDEDLTYWKTIEKLPVVFEE